MRGRSASCRAWRPCAGRRSRRRRASWRGKGSSRSRGGASVRAPSGGASVRAPAECALAFARMLARAVSESEAARALAATPREALVLGDALVAPLAADLAARGILPENDLPLDAAVEL